jgi:hypothetical protein
VYQPYPLLHPLGGSERRESTIPIQQEEERRRKMRCYCCNNILTPAESTRQFKETPYSNGGYTDMCTACLSEISDDVETVEGESQDEELFDDDGNALDD